MMNAAGANRTKVPPQKAGLIVLITPSSYLEFYFKFIQLGANFLEVLLSLTHSLNFQA